MKYFKKIKELKAKYYDQGKDRARKVYLKLLAKTEKNWKKEFDILERSSRLKAKSYDRLMSKTEIERQSWEAERQELLQIRSKYTAIAGEYHETFMRIIHDLTRLNNLKFKLENTNDEFQRHSLKVLNR